MALLTLELIGDTDNDVHEIGLATHYNHAEHDSCIVANFETISQHIGQLMIIDKNEAAQLITFLKAFYNI